MSGARRYVPRIASGATARAARSLPISAQAPPEALSRGTTRQPHSASAGYCSMSGETIAAEG